MLQNPCKTLGFKKNMVYKFPLGGEVNHIQPVAYKDSLSLVSDLIERHSLVSDLIDSHSLADQPYI